MTALTLNLTKAQQSLTLCLQKKGIITPPKVDMLLAMDVSGSFERDHRNGNTNALMSRFVPWGLTFDPDQKLDVLTFSNGANHVCEVGPVTAQNYQNFVQKEIIDRVEGWNGGTDYSYVIEQALRVFGWLESTTQKATGFFGRLFGKKQEVQQDNKRLAVAFIVTDGQNYDKIRTRQVLLESQQRGDKVYFVFVGVSSNPNEFEFIHHMADEFNNVGILEVSNIQEFMKLSDDELNEKIISDEFLTWLKQ